MPDGSLEPVRCGASNRCRYCAYIASTEAAIALKLDAELSMPGVGLTTTTHSPGFSLADLAKAERNLWRALRKDDPELRYCAFLEWTTGEGTHAGGWQRPHLHHLVKGLSVDDPRLRSFFRCVKCGKASETLDDCCGASMISTNELEQHVSRLWETYTGGDAWVVECRRLRTPVSAIKYLALHHRKEAQAPPAGFRGRRLRPSRQSVRDGMVVRRGYYERPIADLRALARQLSRDERTTWLAKQAIEATLIGEGQQDFETDEQLTAAIVEALRDLSARPLEPQLALLAPDSLDQEAHERDRAELILRTKAELDRIREEHPPELVRVRELEQVNRETGQTVRRATAVIGPVTPRQKREILQRLEAVE